MSLKQQFTLMADYNAWMNGNLYRLAAGLDDGDRSRDLGAFFGSIEGTLNHILVADLMWANRFRVHPARYRCLDELDHLPTPTTLSETLYRSFAELHQARDTMDRIIADLIEASDEQDYAVPLHYRNVKGEPLTRAFGPLLMHLFNHQTHHRGQATTLFHQLGVDVGVTDLLVRIPNQGPESP
ncbi:DinB family protein [Marinobacter mangrovi]|uniref:DinB family protein n=1 Tax=Marinobacter mangrovi TaxID=2803918 RepID=UPI001F369B14|nr:DinB family protein [Marinobacter mangrovi]